MYLWLGGLAMALSVWPMERRSLSISVFLLGLAHVALGCGMRRGARWAAVLLVSFWIAGFTLGASSSLFAWASDGLYGLWPLETSLAVLAAAIAGYFPAMVRFRRWDLHYPTWRGTDEPQPGVIQRVSIFLLALGLFWMVWGFAVERGRYDSPALWGTLLFTIHGAVWGSAIGLGWRGLLPSSPGAAGQTAVRVLPPIVYTYGLVFLAVGGACAVLSIPVSFFTGHFEVCLAIFLLGSALAALGEQLRAGKKGAFLVTWTLAVVSVIFGLVMGVFMMAMPLLIELKRGEIFSFILGILLVTGVPLALFVPFLLGLRKTAATRTRSEQITPQESRHV
jgi:hypothetical protein